MGRARAFDKKAVLEKAMRLFQCSGYEAASVQEITEATGLSRSSLYDTFGEKNALYLAALDHYIASREKAMRHGLNETGSKKAAMRAVFRRVVEEIIATPESGCFAVDATTELATSDEKVHALVARNMARNIEAFADAVRAGQQQGEICPDKDPLAIAAFLVNAIHGLRVTGKTTRDRNMLESIVDLALSVLD